MQEKIESLSVENVDQKPDFPPEYDPTDENSDLSNEGIKYLNNWKK